MYKLITIDMYGTLLTEDKKITTKTKDAIMLYFYQILIECKDMLNEIGGRRVLS